MQVRSGTVKPSFTQSLVERSAHPTSEEESVYKWASLGIYGAGADTTISGIETFLIAMSLHPQVQARAHAELMNVVGSNRLPGFSDRGELPYIEAIIQEVLRWNPTVPLGLPHRLMQDDIYRGYYLPAGTIVLANSWAMLHDPDVYPSPMEFQPERFFHRAPSTDCTDEHSRINPDPRRYAFGYARRSCPGRYLAEDVLYITIVATLLIFQIRPMDETKGMKDVEYVGMIRCAI
ncbi:cytochrome P450 [Favolaschia claudopus]|uniref:Cytochrome P450 n=1 Tax=Favolaschia claudopus TaxID=2862362 RepID=A0AAW0E561_9AGAR